MNRRIIGLLTTVCLASACKEEPVGKMEPIPRPPGMAAAPEKAEAPAAKPARAPAQDPSKVVMRWKLDAPTAFRLTTSATSASAPPPSDAQDKKEKDSEPAPEANANETSSVFVLRKTGSGEYAVTITPEGAGGAADQGTMSERGFVVDGLSGPLHTAAALVLELPLEPVSQGATWALGMDLVDLSSVPGFLEQTAQRQNQVKLVELTPAENGEQVATLEYDLSDTVSGNVRGDIRTFKSMPKPQKKDGKKDLKKLAEDAASTPPPLQPASAEVRVKGRGEFLVKAGRWRSWEGTVTTTTEGAPLPGLSGGERKLRLTPLESVPPELLPKQAKQ